MEWLRIIDFAASYVLSALWWIIALSMLAMTINTAHNMHHSYEHYLKEIDSDRQYVESFCSNDTLVRITKRYEECEKARFVASLDPRWEAITSTVEKMHLCARESNPHAIYTGHGGHTHSVTESSFSHCDHAYYILFGAAIAAVVFLFILRRCIVR